MIIRIIIQLGNSNGKTQINGKNKNKILIQKKIKEREKNKGNIEKVDCNNCDWRNELKYIDYYQLKEMVGLSF